MINICNHPDATKIEWANFTFNPWVGCQKTSSGCANCYAERDFTRKPRWANCWGPPGSSERLKTADANWRKPRAWDRKALELGVRFKVFCASLADVFEDNPAVFDWRFELFQLIRETPNLDWLLLTKRPENIKGFLPFDWWSGWSNVWLGVTVENQETAWRLDMLTEIPAIVRFVSCEPVLESIDIIQQLALFDWVISGGESGPNCRPADLDWFRQLRNDCQKWGVPFFHKQHGGNRKIDGAWGGRELDGEIWGEFPGKVKGW